MAGMKSFKAGLPFAVWLLRIAGAVFLFHLCVFSISQFQFSQPEWILSLLFLAAYLILLLGGFFKNPALTIFSGLFIFLFSTYKLFLLASDGVHLSDSSWLIFACIGFFFFCYGNK
jgi:hypothetical protein